jgi:hypothetical protein
LIESCKLEKQDFTRNRSLTFINLTIFITNFIKKSLQLELYNFADFFSIPSVTKQAFSKARKKLPPLVFILLNKKLIEEFYVDNTIRTFKGLRLLAIDGSSLRLPTDSKLFEEYGGDTVSLGVPLAKVSVMFDVLNYITLHGCIDKYRSSERDMVMEHIKQLPSDDLQSFKDLLIFDRGYPSLGLLFALCEQQKHFLMRFQENFLSETTAVIKSNKNDVVITINAFNKTRKINSSLEKYSPGLLNDSKIQVRVLIFELSNGHKEYIITSLIDQNQFSYDDIFTIYGMRWGIEENYKFYKSVIELENFSGKTKIAIEQDFYATIFAGNTSALLMLEAQDEIEEAQKNKSLKFKYKINRNILIGSLKNEILDVLMGSQNLNEYCEKLKIRIKKNLVPIRTGRKFPRVFKRIRSTIDKRAL